MTELQLCLTFYIFHTFYTLPEYLNTQTYSAHVLQKSELRVSLTQITKKDHKIHNVDDKFTITHSWINITKVLKTQSRSTTKSGKTVFQNFLSQNSIFRDMMQCHWVISSQHSFKAQEPLNDTECCKNLKFHNFLSVKKIHIKYIHASVTWVDM